MLPKLAMILGSGRCGSYSAHALLKKQRGVLSTHEHYHMPWNVDPGSCYKALLRMVYLQTSQRGMLDFQEPVGYYLRVDAAFYWLNYAQFVFSMIPGARMLCLYREKDEVVESFVRHMPEQNHWTAADSKHYDPEKWGSASSFSDQFPSYDLPKEEAIAKYWEEYYTTAEAVESVYGQNFFRIVDFRDFLNNAAVQHRHMVWLGVDPGKLQVQTEIHLNYGELPKSRRAAGPAFWTTASPA